MHDEHDATWLSDVREALPATCALAGAAMVSRPYSAPMTSQTWVPQLMLNCWPWMTWVET